MQYSKSILITLGHNSSVIYFGGLGEKPIGYEEERLSKKKSDSSYPRLSLEKLVYEILTKEQVYGCNVFISHWFDNFELEKLPGKYFNYGHLKTIIGKFNLTVIPVNASFTHHDAHAYSTLAFAENFPTRTVGKKHYIVMDGFGNNQEVVSIYEQIDQDDPAQTFLMPVRRIHGYSNSLGLLYQYATSFTGMKENQDEYKFLGYESAITEILSPNQIGDLQIEALTYSQLFATKCLSMYTQAPVASYSENPIGIDIELLSDVKKSTYEALQAIVDKYCITLDARTTTGIRTVIGFYVQACLEECILRIISKYNIENAYLSGGCFLNVKLNKVILDTIKGHICVNPLAGDQGAAIGLFRNYTKTYFEYADLCFGIRDDIRLANATKLVLMQENIYVKTKDQDVIEAATHFLEKDCVVNIIRGSMEFGPRALCNTSTLALPTQENSKYINMVNKRNEVMPMAPVMLLSAANNLLYKKQIARVIGSNKFMIITHDFATYEYEKRGILHNKPLGGGYTCRPQVVDDSNSVIGRILSNLSHSYDCIINTSFNTHGTPILYNFEDAILDFRKQKMNDPDSRKLILIMQIND